MARKKKVILEEEVDMDISDTATDDEAEAQADTPPTELEELEALYAEMQKWNITSISQIEARISQLRIN